MRILVLTLLILTAWASRAQTYTFKTLYSFPKNKSTSQNPGPVILDSAGNLYGVTANGGTYGFGTAFKLTPAKKFSVLYNFGAVGDGWYPYALSRDSAGNLYGVTANGGANYAGNIFKVAGTKETVLYNFGSDESNVFATQPTGALYGYDFNNSYGEISQESNGQLTVLWAFCSTEDCSNSGYNPVGVPIQLASGALAGVNSAGGAENCGAVWSLQNGTLTVLYTFLGSAADGCGPSYKLTQDKAGNLYGLTSAGGENGAGVVFKLAATGEETILYNFPANTPGWSPLVVDSAGAVYGIAGLDAAGYVYRIPATGAITTVAAPGAGFGYSLAIDAHGNLYGTNISGGTAHRGAIWELAK